MAVTRLTCSSCKVKWNVLITFTDAQAKPKRTPRYLPKEQVPIMPDDDGIVTDYTGENVLCKVCGNPLEDDGECLLCGKHTGALPEAQEVTDENSSGL